MNEAHEKLVEMIKDIQFTMLTTVNSEGRLHSRPMATLEVDKNNFDGTLWFFTKRDSLKVQEINREKEVNLSYANPDSQRYISLTGLASVEKDVNKMRELWNPMLKSWFPDELNDPELALLKVEVDSAEYWEAPQSKVIQTMAMISGKTSEKNGFSHHLDIKARH
jgi:general stress protein 26